MPAIGCPSGSTPPCFASCRQACVGGGWNCSIDHSHPICGQRDGKENRVIFYANTDGDVVTAEMLGGRRDGTWILPKARPMTEHDTSDWHGQASLWLPSDMPEIEVARRLAIARQIHDPETSQENCCRRKREMLKKEVAA